MRMTEAQSENRHAADVEGELCAGMGKSVRLPFATVIERVEEELKKEGFGVLTRIDVRATLREKLGVETPPFVILGACNPPLAHQALAAEPEAGLLLPCNVVVRETGPRTVRVEAINARMLMALFPHGRLEAVAGEVTERLARVVNAI